MFSEVLGIRPWEWDQIEVSEVYSLVAYIDEQIKQAREAARG